MTKRTISLTETYGADSISFDASAPTRDGYMTATAKVARSGIQLYRGAELDPTNEFGMRDKKVVRVWRSPDEVFSADSMKSYAHKPVTLDHPADLVNSKTWKEHAVGSMGGEVLRDGTFVRVPLSLMDHNAIDAVKNRNIKELSAGYTMDLAMDAGTTPEGEQFDASMSNIRINHLAVVRAARGGPELRIRDEDKHKENLVMKNFMVDGVSVSAEDIHAQVIERGLATRDGTIADLKTKLERTTADAAAAKAAADKAAEDSKKAIDAKTVEVDVLTKKAKDAELTPEKLEALVAAHSEIKMKAAAILGDKFDYKGKSPTDLMRAVAAHAVGDEKAKAYGPAELKVAFDFAVKDAKVTDGVRVLADTLRAAGDVTTVTGSDRTEAAGIALRDKAFEELQNWESNAWQSKEGVKAAA